MDRNGLLELINTMIDSVFGEFEDANDIPFGDVHPLIAIEIDELEERLADLIIQNFKFFGAIEEM